MVLEAREQACWRYLQGLERAELPKSLNLVIMQNRAYGDWLDENLKAYSTVQTLQDRCFSSACNGFPCLPNIHCTTFATSIKMLQYFGSLVL